MFAKCKPALLILLVVALVLPALSACKPAETAPKQIEIQVWHRWGGQIGETTAKLARDFEAKNPGIVIKDTQQPGEYMDLLQKMIANVAAGKEPPDIFIGGYNLLSYINEELKPTPVDKVGGAEAQEVFDRYEPAVLNLAKFDGKQIGLPFAVSNIVMYYNPEIFQAAGLDPNAPPKTWDEVYSQGKIIKEKTGKYPVVIQKIDNWPDQALIFSNGGRLLSEDGKCVALDTPEAVAAYEMWAKLHKDGLAPKGTDEELTASFTGGGVAMCATTIGRLSSFRQNAKFELGVAPFPAFEGKKTALPAGGAAIMFFNKDAAKQKAAWEFAKYVLSEEAMQTWAQTGYVCPTKAKVKMEKGQEVAYEQLPNAVQWVSWPGGAKGLEMDRLFLDERTKIIYGDVAPGEGLAKVQAACNALVPGCK